MKQVALFLHFVEQCVKILLHNKVFLPRCQCGRQRQRGQLRANIVISL